MKEKLIALVRSLIFPLIYLAVQLVMSFIMAFAAGFSMTYDMLQRGAEYTESQMMEFLTNYLSENTMAATLAAAAVTVAILLITLKVQKRPLRRTLELNPVPAKKTAVILFAGLAANLASGLLMGLLPLPEAMLSEYEQTVAQNLYTGDLGMSLLGLVIVIPVTEELVFRGMCRRELGRAFPVAAVVVLQAVIFALAHLNPYQMIYVVIAAVLMGLVFYWSGSLLGSILFHAAYNSVGLLVSVVDQSVAEGPVMQWMTLASPVVLIVCMVLLFRMRWQGHQIAFEE